MEVKNMLSKSLDATEERAKLDAACKRLIANKIILAWIMKHSMEEYAAYTIEEIAAKYIEGTPEIANVAVHQDENVPEMITGTGTESTSIQEGTITYDVRFIATHPRSGERVRLLVNLEVQADFYPGYPLIKRGIYYGSRMISSQYGTEFTDSEYGKIKKVYSIWICLNPPMYRQNTINRYAIREENMIGTLTEKREHYDLMTVIMICLGDPKKAQSDLLKMLGILFSDEKSAAEKRQILQEELDIKMTKSVESEVAEVCNYGDYVWMKGVTHGEKQGEARGEARGGEKKLVKIVCNMFAKGTVVADIADMLGEELAVVEEICQVATWFAPDYDCDKIYEKLQESRRRQEVRS